MPDSVTARLTIAMDELEALLTRLTPLQRQFLGERYKHNRDKDAASVMGLHPGTVWNWRHLSADFRQAEQLYGRILLEQSLHEVYGGLRKR